jgi:hypothetical protein
MSEIPTPAIIELTIGGGRGTGSGGGGSGGDPRNVFILEFVDGELTAVRRSPDGINGLYRSATEAK